MSYVDEEGIVHVTASDEVTPWSCAHIAACYVCSARFKGPTDPTGLLPLDRIGVPPEPTGRARHRKDGQ
jgi:hypothetical protein